MYNKKNQVTVLIDDCQHCPNAALKYSEEVKDDFMYCQTEHSCVQLRKWWGERPIPDWCPLLERQKHLCGKE